jgi:putative membrane protein insertion efficiency factor
MSRRFASQVLISPIRLYQAWHHGRVSTCRFVPSCSQYAIEAIETKGPLRGGWLALRRLARCRPHGGYGFDPIPS